MQTYLDSGNYLATVTQYPNFAIGSSLSDGFWGSNFSGSGSHYALDILNVSHAALGVSFDSVSPIPELLRDVAGRAWYRWICCASEKAYFLKTIRRMEYLPGNGEVTIGLLEITLILYFSAKLNSVAMRKTEPEPRHRPRYGAFLN